VRARGVLSLFQIKPVRIWGIARVNTGKLRKTKDRPFIRFGKKAKIMGRDRGPLPATGGFFGGAGGGGWRALFSNWGPLGKFKSSRK